VQVAIKGGLYPVLEEEPQFSSPGKVDFDPEMFKDIAKKLGLSAEWKQRHG